ncbi:MAG: hypothetical protein JOY59_07000, partial [Candidatus Eremiobacteraeota bacterium]|nr:hypothetical protein [Candidatus Eremiobacteraeota bacterium]
MPSFFVETLFLGVPCGAAPAIGVNPEFSDRLVAADRIVRSLYDALPPEERLDLITGETNAPYARWCGAVGPHAAWIPYVPHHAAGAAIDANPTANPYIVTRNGSIPGGERGGEALVDMRARALAAFDRAVRFRGGAAESADVSPRKQDESIASAWERFSAVSDALADYLQLVIRPELGVIRRVALFSADDVTDDALLATIGEDERVPLEEALPRLAEFGSDPRALYVRILRDYEEARIPMTLGAPSEAPAQTRNPARGFLNLRREIVVALCDQGLRWGACDFDVRPDGGSENG